MTPLVPSGGSEAKLALLWFARSHTLDTILAACHTYLRSVPLQPVPTWRCTSPSPYFLPTIALARA